MGAITRQILKTEVDLWNFIREYYKCPECKEKIQRHIVQEGARYHVIRYMSNGMRCSERDCEENHLCKSANSGSSSTPMEDLIYHENRALR